MKHVKFSKMVISFLSGSIVGAIGIGKYAQKNIGDSYKKTNKFKNYYSVLTQWLTLKQKNQSLEKYFIDNGYKTIAVYGMGELGNRLYEELKETEIIIKYGIDKNGGFGEIEILDIDDELPEVDVVVVTAVFDFDKIEGNLRDKVNCPVISLEDIVYDC